MTEPFDERNWHLTRRADELSVSKRIHRPSDEPIRIVSRVIDGESGLNFATALGETVLRRTAGGRYEIKATFLEDTRELRVLTIQKYNDKSGPSDTYHFSFVGDEIVRLKDFLAVIDSLNLSDPSKFRLRDRAVDKLLLNDSEAQRVFRDHQKLFLQLAQQEDIAHDLVAVGYRKRQIAHFERLLSDVDFFADEQRKTGCRPEDVWQQFFEANTWIFGYGLSYQFLSGLDGRKLEQAVRGRDLNGAGKRSDALMKTLGIVNSLCFVEIKRHDTALLEKRQYRPDVWAPSTELVGGVTQVQATVQAAVSTLGETLFPHNEEGSPTGETLFNVAPRSCLVVGSLDQFKTDTGINRAQFRSFELFRRNTWRPEIITFDELLQRARFIVTHDIGGSSEPKDRGV